VTPEGEERLRAQVERIVRAGVVPRRSRADVAEEMLGHLSEAVERLRAAGADEHAAIDQALGDFGETDVVADELARTYHSELWLSTIGVLVGGREDLPKAPGAIVALRLVLWLDMALAAITAWLALANGTPVRAVLVAIGAIAYGAGAALALRGLLAGRRWAFRYAIGVLFLMVGSAWLDIDVGTRAGRSVIPVSGIVAACILVYAWASLDRIREFLAGSTPITSRLSLTLGATLLGSVATGLTGATIMDPTQATARDLDMTVAMICGRKDLESGEGVLRDRQVVTVTVDLRWRRVDALPFGLAGAVNGDAGSDTSGFRFDDPEPEEPDADGQFIPGWTLFSTQADVRVVETGAQVGGWGA